MGWRKKRLARWVNPPIELQCVVGCLVGQLVGKAVVTTAIRLRFDRRSTPIRLQFDRATTIRRPVLRP